LRANRNRITPDGDGVDDSVLLTPSVSPANEIVRFSGRIESLSGQTIVEADGVTPAPVVWDGRDARGRTLDSGAYVAVLEVEHRNGTIVEARTDSIAVGDEDVTAPRVAVQLDPPLFSPDGDGIADTVSMTLDIVDDGEIASWEIRVYEPGGALFHSFPVGAGDDGQVIWNGRNAAGELVEMAVDYQIVAEVADAAGNVGTGDASLVIDVLTEARFGKRRILVDDVLFEGYTTRFLYWDSRAEAQNIVSLEKIGDILRKFPDYRIELDGHAVSLLYYDEDLSDREHQEILIPLSEARAEVIRDLFVSYGADGDRFDMSAWGKLRPLVPFANLEARPINRRVEFYLVR
jgi:hypothetical protein